MKRTLGCTLGLLVFALNGFSGRAQGTQTAQQILSEATSRASQQQKVVFLEFSASWCKPCHLLDAFLSSPDIAPIVQKYFVRAEVHYEEKVGKHPELETPGADTLAARFGSPEGVPWFAFLDANGQVIVTSDRPVTGSIGYPDRPEEIDWFMTMLRKGAPAMDEDETHRIESWLRNASTYH